MDVNLFGGISILNRASNLMQTRGRVAHIRQRRDSASRGQTGDATLGSGWQRKSRRSESPKGGRSRSHLNDAAQDSDWRNLPRRGRFRRSRILTRDFHTNLTSLWLNEEAVT